MRCAFSKAVVKETYGRLHACLSPFGPFLVPPRVAGDTLSVVFYLFAFCRIFVFCIFWRALLVTYTGSLYRACSLLSLEMHAGGLEKHFCSGIKKKADSCSIYNALPIWEDESSAFFLAPSLALCFSFPLALLAICSWIYTTLSYSLRKWNREWRIQKEEYLTFFLWPSLIDRIHREER